jgi:hypothetical protein
VYLTKPAEGLGGRLHKRCLLRIAGAVIGDHGEGRGGGATLATALVSNAGRRIGIETDVGGKQNVTEEGQDVILTMATLEL